MRIKTFLDKSKGIEVTVHMLKNGRYKVVCYDIDEMEYLQDCPEFLDRGRAMAYAERQVA